MSLVTSTIHWDHLSDASVMAVLESSDQLATLLINAGMSPAGLTPVAWLDDLRNIAQDVLTARRRDHQQRMHNMELISHDDDTWQAAAS